MSKHVLVVDDELRVRLQLKQAFETLGYKVSLAIDAKSGLEVLERVATEGQINLVVVDYEMGQRKPNGLWFIEQVRKKSQCGELKVPNDLPIIFFAGTQNSDIYSLAEKLGVSAALRKHSKLATVQLIDLATNLLSTHK